MTTPNPSAESNPLAPEPPLLTGTSGPLSPEEESVIREVEALAFRLLGVSSPGALLALDPADVRLAVVGGALVTLGCVILGVAGASPGEVAGEAVDTVLATRSGLAAERVRAADTEPPPMTGPGPGGAPT
jgi:hypothetical protein